MAHEAPPIVKLAQRILVDVEKAVRGFSRYHKYQIGADLRRGARVVARGTIRAWRNNSQKAEHIARLVNAVDDLKLEFQIAKDLEAFASFGAFEALARDLKELGQQCGGWQRRYPKSQNDSSSVSGQRAQILSARAASCEANA